MFARPRPGRPASRYRYSSAMAEYISSREPSDGVSLITMHNPAIRNFGSWQAIGELADALVAAREGSSRVVVLASDVPGHWFEHAWLTDLIATFEGTPTTGDGGAWFRCLHELNQTNVVSIAAVSGNTNGGGCELGWAETPVLNFVNTRAASNVLETIAPVVGLSQDALTGPSSSHGGDISIPETPPEPLQPFKMV